MSKTAAIAPNREAFDTLQQELLEHYKAKNPKDTTSTRYARPWIANDDSGRYLIIIEPKVSDFDFSAYDLISFDPDDPVWNPKTIDNE